MSLMDLVITLLFAAVVLLAARGLLRNRRRSLDPDAPASHHRRADERAATGDPHTRDLHFLEAFWKEVRRARRQGRADELVPSWYFDAPTAEQLEQAEREVQSVHAQGLTRGQLADLIDLGKPPDEKDMAVLRYFGETRPELNRATARVRARMLLSDRARRAEWETRRER